MEDIYDLLDQLFVIATRTDGRLSGIIAHLTKSMSADEQLEFRRQVQEVELNKMTVFLMHIGKREPEVAAYMQGMFERMKGRESWETNGDSP